MVREYTDKLLEMVEEGMISAENALMCCMKYMSEDDVKDMMECNELIDEEGSQ